MTAKLSGYSRVFSCAKARAIELLCAVAATGVIGRAPGSTQNPTNVSACAVYLPCEPSLGMDGVLGPTAPTGERSAERRVGNECVRTCSYRGLQYHLKKQTSTSL